MLLKKLIIAGIIILSFYLQVLNAQDTIPFHYINLNFKEYIDLVETNNLQYAAEKLNINISEAAIEVAKIFHDPYISVDWSGDYDNRIKTGDEFSSEIVKTIDLAGKRNSRIELSLNENELTKALLADYFRKLQSEATLVYLEAMKQRQLFMVRYNSYQTMKQLYEADSIRLKLGSIMEIDATQSRLEAGIIFNELIHAMVEWKNSLSKLSIMTGTSRKDTLFLPISHLHNRFTEFSLNKLITTAQNNRADIIAALFNKKVAEKYFSLSKKERKTDLDLKFGVTNTYLAGESTRQPSMITAGIAVPLKLSNRYKGEIKMAQVRIQQAEELYKHVELLIEAEITQAWELYQGYCRQVDNFDKELLENAENVRKGKIYSYQRGETSLLEVLNAQRTFNEIQTTYYETLYNRAASLVELEKAAGIWDINF